MANPKTPPPAILVVAITAQQPVADDPSIHETMISAWGPIVGESEKFPFDEYTRYYLSEMGSGLVKWLICFENPVRPELLADIKLAANKLEERWITDGSRAVNIDPGYMTPMTLVLASAKQSPHRIYLRDGIHAEMTLHYESGYWQPWSWTYDDFKQQSVIDALDTWRIRALDAKAEFLGKQKDA